MKAYFFPGLGADKTLAPYHQIPELEIEWVNWPSHIRTNWENFLQDLLRENDIQPGSLFIGISFGGLVATRLAKLIPPSGIILVGSLVDAKAVLPIFRILKRVLPCIPGFAFNLGWVPSRFISYFFGIRRKAHLTHFKRMAGGYSPQQTKALIQLALSASPMENRVPIYAIHGEKDRILPYKKAQSGYLVRQGGHLLSMTHADEVNDAISGWLKNQ